MYTTKLTNREREDKLLKIRKQKDNIEFGHGPYGNAESRNYIESWKAFERLPFDKQLAIRKEWQDYYDSVKESPIYMLLMAQGEASRAMSNFKTIDLADEEAVIIRNNASKRFKDLSAQARETRKNGDAVIMPMPKSIDPWEYSQGWVRAYKNCEKAISELSADYPTSDINEIQEVWEPSNKRQTTI